MSEPFKTGDVVRLKSGGPRMTVRSRTSASCACVWFNPAGGYSEHGFDLDVLVLVSDPRKPDVFDRVWDSVMADHKWGDWMR